MSIHIHHLPAPPELFEVEHLGRLHPEIHAFSEMMPVERAFLNGLVRLYKPRKIVEMGVSAGASACVILNAIQDLPETKLISIDVAESWYRDTSKAAGWLGNQYFKENQGWALLTGEDPVEVIENIGGGIDFCLIDTAHLLPVEVLNFLTVLPFLTDDAVVVLHDISLYAQSQLMDCVYTGGHADAYACRHVFDTAAADRLTLTEDCTGLPNIGAFQVNADTRKYIDGMFGSLAMRWFVPMHEDVELMQRYRDFFEKYYGRRYALLFQSAVDAQPEIANVMQMQLNNQLYMERIAQMYYTITDSKHDTVFLYGAEGECKRMMALLPRLGIKLECIVSKPGEQAGQNIDAIAVRTLEDVIHNAQPLPFVLTSFDPDETDEAYQTIAKAFFQAGAYKIPIIYQA